MEDRRVTHGKYGSRIYRIWAGMKSRCTDTDRPRFKDYGGRGITVDERWQSFENFYEDMIGSYQKELTLDRIDCNGNYCKENCRWATVQQQNANRRNNVEYEGKKLSRTDWAKELGMKKVTLQHRLKRGWSVERALTTPVRAFK